MTLKYAAGAEKTANAFVEAARTAGLPLTASPDRRAVEHSQLVVAMGADHTMAQLRASLTPHQTFDAHGHRFSVAWVTGEASVDPVVPEGFRDPWGAVAADLALHDGRGCLSPVAVFTPLPLEEAAEALADAMVRAEARWPLGEVGAGEWAQARSRGALATVTGFCVPAGRGAVHALPLRLFEPSVLPRHPALFHVPDAEALMEVLRPWAPWLSTVGTESTGAASAVRALGAVRVCGLGRMQRPNLVRLHDGRDWVGATVRS
ncbi:MAG: hypothetical protein EP330_23705 [Deltaproteobacteria bacterium]|nr:MAG: hypothetical protein EP330_23705 [Deltaproteobacteria bacterium]